MVYLITGKKDAGKTTYANRLADELMAEGVDVTLLDGDVWRKYNDNNDYTDQGRFHNLISAAHMAKEYEEVGTTVIMSFVAPRKEWRDRMREYFDKSVVVYIPGGTLWEGTTYERPDTEEMQLR